MAAWLVAIIALPFTAPLATCDIGDILQSGPPGAPTPPARPDAPAADVTVSVPPVLCTAPGRLRLILVPHTLVASTAIPDNFVPRGTAGIWRPARPPQLSPQQRQVLRI